MKKLASLKRWFVKKKKKAMKRRKKLTEEGPKVKD